MTILQRHVARTAPLVFLLGVLLGMIVLLLLLLPFIFAQSQDTASDTMLALSTANTFRYGIVESVEGDRTIVISMNDHITLTPHVRVRVLSSAYIARQHLQGPAEAYDSLSPVQSALLTDISQGDGILFLPQRDSSGALTTNYLVFGNPL